MVVRVETGDVVARLAGSVRYSEWTCFDPAGRFLAFSVRHESQNLLEVYDSTSWQKVDLPADFTCFLGFAFTSDSSVLAVVTHGANIDLWRVRDWHKVQSIHCGAQPHCVDFSPDGRLLAVGDWRGRIAIYRTDIWERHHIMGWHQGWVHTLRFAPDSRTLASVSHGDKTLRLWQVP